jgi:DNA invertase Pin-like site-specific DNA recombinase
MKGFYIRVSTLEQNTDRQNTGEPNTYIDKVSGSIPFAERPQAKKLLEDIDKGIITEIEVHSIDRLGRSTLDIMQTIQALTAKGVNVISKKEGLQTLVDGKENPVAKLMIGILGTLAEFELSRLKERQTEGIAKAKEKGVYVGRNVDSAESEEVFMNKAKSQIILKHLKNGETVRRTALLSKSSINTVRKVDAIVKAKIPNIKN